MGAGEQVCACVCTYAHVEARGCPWVLYSGRFSFIFKTESSIKPGAYGLGEAGPRGPGSASASAVLGIQCTGPCLASGSGNRTKVLVLVYRVFYQLSCLCWSGRMLLLRFLHSFYACRCAMPECREATIQGILPDSKIL